MTLRRRRSERPPYHPRGVVMIARAPEIILKTDHRTFVLELDCRGDLESNQVLSSKTGYSWKAII